MQLLPPRHLIAYLVVFVVANQRTTNYFSPTTTGLTTYNPHVSRLYQNTARIAQIATKKTNTRLEREG